MNSKNEHVFPRKGGWSVKREGSKKTSKSFERKRDAMEYASIIALNEGGSVVSHKHNGQFKNFKYGNEIYIEPHKIGPIITGTTEITHPIVNKTEQEREKTNLI